MSQGDSGKKIPSAGREPLGEEKLINVFENVAWEGLAKVFTEDPHYSGLAKIGLVKVCALPFVINIPSERSLGRVLKDSQLLRNLCGLNNTSPSDIPSRATLWHFRKKHTGKYKWWLLQALSLMAAGALEGGLSLPFMAAPPSEGSFEKRTFNSVLPKGKVEIFARRSLSVDDHLDSAKNSQGAGQHDLFEEFGTTGRQKQQRAEKERISEFTGLPAEVRIGFSQQCDALHFGIVEPSWHYQNILDFDRGIPMFRDDATQNSYAACNILLIRERNGKEQMLVARRLDGGFGFEELAAPGGKKRPGETILECVRRELREETGLNLKDPKDAELTSCRETNFKNKPPVTSLGFVVYESAVTGNLAQREGNLGKWTWEDVQSMNGNLFPPTQIALTDYLEGGREEFTWGEAAEKVRRVEPSGPSLFDNGA